MTLPFLKEPLDFLIFQSGRQVQKVSRQKKGELVFKRKNCFILLFWRITPSEIMSFYPKWHWPALQTSKLKENELTWFINKQKF